MENNALDRKSEELSQPTQAPDPQVIPTVFSATTDKVSINKGISFYDLLKTWQPMGIRLVINLPFIGDDRTPLVYIRHTPLIPHLFYPFAGSAGLWNNRFPVRTVPGTQASPSAISITQHSPPPLASVMALSHRRWRGGIHYRLNAVTNFTAAGYVWVAKMRNCGYNITNSLPNTIAEGFRAAHLPASSSTYDGAPSGVMANSFLRSDVSMFRHIEVVSPYEYPLPWQDMHFEVNTGSFNASVVANDTEPALLNGDDWIVLGLRGQIAASDTSNQLMYELEYKLGDDFEFSQPLLPFCGWSFSPGQQPVYAPGATTSYPQVVTVPSTSGTVQVNYDTGNGKLAGF